MRLLLVVKIQQLALDKCLAWLCISAKNFVRQAEIFLRQFDYVVYFYRAARHIYASTGCNPHVVRIVQTTTAYLDTVSGTYMTSCSRTVRGLSDLSTMLRRITGDQALPGKQECPARAV